MRPKALEVLRHLDGEMPLSQVAVRAGLTPEGTSRAVAELAGLGLVTKQREGVRIVIAPAPQPALEALRLELARFPDLDIADTLRGRRAALLAGVGFAKPVALRRIVGLSKGAAEAAFKSFLQKGVLRLDHKTKYRVSDGHLPLQAFCQALCDLETRAWLDRAGLRAARILWTRANEAVVALEGGKGVPRGMKPAAYTAAANTVLFISRDSYFIRSLRRQSWGDTLLQCLLVPPRTRLTRAHATIMYARRRARDLEGLARWYGLAPEAARIRAFVDEGADDPAILPRGDVREIAAEYGVVV